MKAIYVHTIEVQNDKIYAEIKIATDEPVSPNTGDLEGALEKQSLFNPKSAAEIRKQFRLFLGKDLREYSQFLRLTDALREVDPDSKVHFYQDDFGVFIYRIQEEPVFIRWHRELVWGKLC